MGCICSKGILSGGHHHAKDRERKLSKSSKRFVASLRRDDVVVEADGSGNDAMTRLISSPHEVENEVEKKRDDNLDEKPVKPLQRRAMTEVGPSGGHSTREFRVGSMPQAERGAQIVAGWPSWLVAVAGEAINGWIPRRADSFEKLEKIGQGTYSSVYRARDLETNKIVALKKVRFANMDPESVRFMAREIIILRRLDHPNVMKLEALITSRVSGSLYLVFEYMEHDLAGLAASPGLKFTEGQVKCYMQQLLRGLQHCHSHGVLHRDIKGSNLLIDNNGNLKIGDFGLATFFGSHQKQPLTSRVVTLWYRPPELLLGSSDYGVSVDLWSSGCILAELFAGKPIMPGRTEVEQLHKIFKLCGSPSEEYWKKSKLPHATVFKPQHPYKRCLAETFKHFPSTTLALLHILLAIEPEHRGTASSALQHEFFTTDPLPCDPSDLPKYPPSKEFDAKLRDEEARRRKAAGGKGRPESTRKGIKEARAAPAPDANAELKSSIQKRKAQPNSGSNSEKFNIEEDGGSGFRIEPPQGTVQNNSTLSGTSSHTGVYGAPHMTDVTEDEAVVMANRESDSSRNGVEMRRHRSFVHRGASQLSRFSNSVAAHGSSHLDCSSRETSANSQWREESFNLRCNHLGSESSAKDDWSHHLLSSHKKGREHSGKEFAPGYALRKSRIHYSGPLLPPGDNLEEMLKEHERQIQHAVRKARLDKAKTKRDHAGNGQTESLLYGCSGR